MIPDDLVNALTAIFQDTGEFVRDDDYHEVVCPTLCNSSVCLYCPKPSLVLRFQHLMKRPTKFVVCGGPILPNKSTITRIFPNGCPSRLKFLSDLGPFELALFLILKSSLRASVDFAGINDSFFPANFDIHHSLQSISDFEWRFMEVFRERQFLDSILEMVGERCFKVLNAGQKLELAAIANPNSTCSQYVMNQFELLH